MQKEITEATDLFDDEGKLIQTGWAKKLILNYNREKIRIGSLRVKDWDCYNVMCPDYGISLIVADVGYFGMATVDWRDYKNQKNYGAMALKLFTRGKLNLPTTSVTGDVYYTKGENWMKFERNETTGDNRILSFDFPNFEYNEQRGISGKITLYQDPKQESIVNVIPFKKPKHFVYAQKIPCMPAEGEVQIGDETFEFQGEKNNSYTVIDWSRGAFPYRTIWWWAYASGKVDGVSFGLNIDYGFGTESSKSMLFYDGKGHHLDEVTYTWDDKDLMKPWIFTSNDGRCELKLTPVAKHKGGLNLLILRTGGIYVYGYITGEVILDDGTKIKIKESDKLFGSAEHCRHRW